MNRTVLLLGIVLADFLALTGWALHHHGYVGLFEAALATPAGIQVGVDLVIALSLFMTAYVMAPVGDEAWREGVAPYIEGKMSEGQAYEAAVKPLRSFMLAQVRERDLALFSDLAAQSMKGAPREATDMRILAPAFLISEIRRGFEIGFLIVLPFLVIDLIVAVVVMAMGMMMLPPSVLSLPLKVLFFVLIDGWSLLAGSLVRSYS